LKPESQCLTVSVEEAGRLLGYSRNSAYEAARTGELPTIRLGSKMRVPKIALDRLLEAGQPRGNA
jgi:excisionase family DNA binding protein